MIKKAFPGETWDVHKQTRFRHRPSTAGMQVITSVAVMDCPDAIFRQSDANIIESIITEHLYLENEKGECVEKDIIQMRFHLTREHFKFFFNYLLNKSEEIKQLIHEAQIQNSIKILMPWIVLTAIALIVNQSVSVFTFIILVGLPFICLSIIVYIFTPRFFKRRMLNILNEHIKTDALQREQKMTITDEYIHIQDKIRDSKICWHGITKVIEDDEMIYLFTGLDSAFFIHKSFMPNENEFHAIYIKLKQYHQNAVKNISN